MFRSSKNMNTSKYQKPLVTRSGSNPEPVEAGCCLRSCGGVPSPQGGALKPKGQLAKKLSLIGKAK